jgi:hypothetical protein
VGLVDLFCFFLHFLSGTPVTFGPFRGLALRHAVPQGIAFFGQVARKKIFIFSISTASLPPPIYLFRSYYEVVV